jgi:hypothetical protein
MSKAIDNSNSIRTRLLAVPTGGEIALPSGLVMADIDIIVDRQADLAVKIAKAVASAKGVGIVILWTGFTNLDENSSRPRLGMRYEITAWSKPILTAGASPVDDVVEAICTRLHHWNPVANGVVYGEATVRSGDIIDSMQGGKRMLGYTVDVVIPTSL